MTSQSCWRRVSRAHPCAICEKPDWCLFSADGAVAICARVESSKRCGDAGWLHRLKDDNDWRRRGHVRVIRLGSGSSSRTDLGRLAGQYRQNLDQGRLYQLSISLGLSVTSLGHLGVGWSTEHRAWSFPMAGLDGNVLGIRLRRPNGYKFSVKGGKEGLFLPSIAVEESSRLLICEGPTDTAVLLDMAYQNVIGRPNCSGGIKLLAELVRRRRPTELVIVSDNDEPGRRGADNLASVLMVYAPVVKIITPPDPHKDLRDWFKAGGSKREVEEAIAAAAVRQLRVISTRCSNGR
jgi:hypothetical protein